MCETNQGWNQEGVVSPLLVVPRMCSEHFEQISSSLVGAAGVGEGCFSPGRHQLSTEASLSGATMGIPSVAAAPVAITEAGTATAVGSAAVAAATAMGAPAAAAAASTEAPALATPATEPATSVLLL